MPRLSIIVPVYNAARFLDRAVASVRAQTFSDWELILVDDASTDNSPALLERYAAEDGRVRVFWQEANAGPSAARNRGLGEARGEYLAFLDADDALAPECYASMFAAMDAGDADCACCGYVLTGDSGVYGAPVPPPLPAGTHGPDAVREGLILPLLQDRLRENAVTGMVWRWLFRRDTVEALGLRFAGGYYEDEMFLIRYFSGAAPRRLASVAEGLYRYYQTPSSVTHRYFPGFAEHYRWILEEKAVAVREYGLPVREDWRDNCAWAGLLAAVGNEFAPGGPEGARTHRANLKALCAVPDFAHALAHYVPAGMNRRKSIVALLLRRRMYFALTALYAAKNRSRGR